MNLIELIKETQHRLERVEKACQKVRDGLREISTEFDFPVNGTIDHTLCKLTKGQRAVLDLIATNASLDEIAQKLGISKRTVESHRNSIRERLEFSSIKELNDFAATLKK